MSILNQLHYHCLIDPSDNSIISHGETALKECSPQKFGDRLIERWGRTQLPSMRKGEKRTLDYFYATNLIRPHRSLATFSKGPFVAVRRVMGSSDPGHEEEYPYEYGYNGCKPASYEEFPLPENVPDYLAKHYFYDEKAIKVALSNCIEELKAAVAGGFTAESVAKLVSRAEILVASTGGRGLLPHPVPFSTPNEEENAVMILDLVIYAILNEAASCSLPDDVVVAYKKRRGYSDIHDSQLGQLLGSINS